MERPAAVSTRLPEKYDCTMYLDLYSADLLIAVPYGLTHLFLFVNVIAMISCSTLVIARKHSDYAVAGLIGVVVTQALGYGLIFDLNFFLRNLSVMGGLLMVLSDSWVRKSKAFAGLPEIDEKDRKMYFQLAGRVLLIFLFIGFVFSGKWSIWRIITAVMGFVACVMVVVGFKAKFSATMLVLILSVFNLVVNNFWTVRLNSSCTGPNLMCICSFTSIIPTKTSPSTISFRSFPSLVDYFCSSIVDQVNTALTRRRKCIERRAPRKNKDLELYDGLNGD